MRAHVIKNDVIVNTIEVESLDVFPNIIDASIGGGIGDRIVDGALVESTMAPVDLPVLKSRLVGDIDSHIALIYSRWMRFEAEYVEREAAARAFVAAEYIGDPGVWVTSFATSAGKSNQQAADLIIAQADDLRMALQNLGALRMQKYGILSAPTVAAAQSVYDGIIAQADLIAASIS